MKGKVTSSTKTISPAIIFPLSYIVNYPPFLEGVHRGDRSLSLSHLATRDEERCVGALLHHVTLARHRRFDEKIVERLGRLITGDNESTLRNSPLLEAYRKKKIEVLIMYDELDEVVIERR